MSDSFSTLSTKFNDDCDESDDSYDKTDDFCDESDDHIRDP